MATRCGSASPTRPCRVRTRGCSAKATAGGCSMPHSELFGHRKGAFTGSVEARPGLVRAADGGTLFLDEIGDLPLESQAALLRVLQEQQVLPVGDTKPVSVDVRVLAATHADLE